MVYIIICSNINSIKSQSNQKIQEKLIEEARGTNPLFEAADIRSEQPTNNIIAYNYNYYNSAFKVQLTGIFAL